MDTENGNENKTKTDGPERISSFRRALPQVLATSAKNLILLDLGMTMAFPTLVIPALLNSNGRITFNESQASWFGSIAFICQPIGSVISGTVLEPLGRKRSMLLVNIPHLIGWYMYYSAISVSVLFVAAVLMGLGTGFMEAPVITYVGEISEPRLRGILTSYSGIFVTLGLILEFLLGTLYGWETAAFISSFMPILTILAISQVPETPMWLLSKNRVQDAEKSLCWLRGWVPASMVQTELNELTRYSNASKLILQDDKASKISKTDPARSTAEKKVSKLTAYSNPVNIEDEIQPPLAKQSDSPVKSVAVAQNTTTPVEQLHISAELISTPRKATFWEVVNDMFRPQMLRPLGLTIAFFVFHNGSGFPAMRPYMVKIFEELRFPVDAYWATVIISCMGFVGVIVCTVFVKYVGKRRLTLASLLGCAISLSSLSIWTLLDENATDQPREWWPFIFFIGLSFSFSFGLAPIPWMLLSEVFPFRGRGFASGITAAVSYIMGFVTSKTFLSLEHMLGLAGVFSLYGTIMVLGIVYVYFKLPETEGKTLEDIENEYKSKKNRT